MFTAKTREHFWGGTGGNNEPTPTPRPGSGVEHVVKEGDLCVDIAASYGVDVDEMIARQPVIVKQKFEKVLKALGL